MFINYSWSSSRVCW